MDSWRLWRSKAPPLVGCQLSVCPIRWRRRGKEGREGLLFRDGSQGSCEIHNAPIQNNNTKKSRRDESNGPFGVKVTVRRLAWRHEEEKGQQRGGKRRGRKEGEIEGWRWSSEVVSRGEKERGMVEERLVDDARKVSQSSCSLDPSNYHGDG